MAADYFVLWTSASTPSILTVIAMLPASAADGCHFCKAMAILLRFGKSVQLSLPSVEGLLTDAVCLAPVSYALVTAPAG